MGEKTEKATPKKLRDARKKGQVAKSQDLPSAFTFIASIAAILMLSGYLYNYLSGFLLNVFALVTEPEHISNITDVFQQSFMVIFLASIPVMVIVAAIGVLVNFLAVGPVFATEVFKFDIKKFNPVQNLKAKFKMKTLIELLKSVLKISIASYLIYDVMYNSLPTLIKAVSMPISSSFMIFYYFLMEVVVKVGLFFIVIAIFDFIYQRQNFAKEMKMEKFEVKQEHKNTEGDPQIKGKRRQIAQEIAYQEGPAAGVKKARAVVTNPTHLAIAIGYEREVDPAPYILAMGENILAERIIELADKYGVPIIRNVPLAHKLWEEGDVYEFVPEESYEPIAEVLRWIESLEQGAEMEYARGVDLEG